MPFKFPKKFAGVLAAAPALALALSSVPALADDQGDQGDQGDPGVARLSVLAGGVDVKRSDSGETFAAAVNAPVSAGDYITTQDDSHAEVEYTFGSALRVAPDTQLRFTRLDPENHVAQLAQGTVEMRVLRGVQSHPEVDTPDATVRPDEDGRYRVTVTNDGDSEVTARSGRVDVITQAGTQTLAPGSTLRITGSPNNAQFETVGQVGFDNFDRWNDERDAYAERAHDYAYVDQGIVGADDLDQYGRWTDVPGYGNVWQPTDVDPGWAPYHDGRWTWQPYYGWTWVAAEPWGWAPYHYGRWFYADNSWCWYPGVSVGGPIGYSSPVEYGRWGRPAIYQPALVAFFSFGGGGGFGGGLSIGLGFGNIGWVPLAPFESFHPWWGGGRGYDRGGNSITNITNITNNYGNTYNNYGNITKNYRNARVAGGAVAVNSANFAAGNFQHVTPVRAEQLRNVVAMRGVVPVVPTAHNLAFSARTPSTNPATANVANRFAHFTAPSVAVRPFQAQQSAIRELAVKAYPANTTAFQHPEELARSARAGLSGDPAANAQRATSPVSSERATTERASTERATTESAATERANTEHAATERANTERAATERANTERVTTERANTERVNTELPGTTERGTTERPVDVERSAPAVHASSPWDRFSAAPAKNASHEATVRNDANVRNTAGHTDENTRAATPAVSTDRAVRTSNAKADPFSRFGDSETSRAATQTYKPATTSRSSQSTGSEPRSYQAPSGESRAYQSQSTTPRSYQSTVTPRSYQSTVTPRSYQSTVTPRSYQATSSATRSYQPADTAPRSYQRTQSAPRSYQSSEQSNRSYEAAGGSARSRQAPAPSHAAAPAHAEHAASAPAADSEHKGHEH